MTPVAQKRSYGLTEVAEMFGVSRDTIKRLVFQGEIKSFTVAGRRLISAAEIDRIEHDGVGTPRVRKAQKVGR